MGREEGERGKKGIGRSEVLFFEGRDLLNLCFQGELLVWTKSLCAYVGIHVRTAHMDMPRTK